MAAAKPPARTSATPRTTSAPASPAGVPAKPAQPDGSAFARGYRQRRRPDALPPTREGLATGLGRGVGRADNAADSAAGFLLGFLAWAWVGLPLLKGGPTEVKRVLMAKFLNKSPDGKWLP